MKRNLLLLLAVLLIAVPPAFATLCGKCRDRVYTKDIGSCVECAGMTTSGAFKLCMKCSDRLRQCEHCRAALAAAVAEIDLERNGTYRSGRWTYEYTISNEGSRSQGYHGKILVDGVPVAEPERINDFHQTPWGPLYWVGQPVVAFGVHGWMPKPLAREPVGRQLPEPPPATGPLAVLVKVIHADRTGLAGAVIEPWIAAELDKAGAISPGVAQDWTALGPEVLTLHDSRHYGLLQVRAEVVPAGRPLVVELVGGPQPSVELPPQAGATRFVHCTLTSSVASMDVYLAFKVESASRPAAP